MTSKSSKTALPAINSDCLIDLFDDAKTIPRNLEDRGVYLTSFLNRLNGDINTMIDDEADQFIASSRVSIAATVLLRYDGVLKKLGAFDSDDDPDYLTVKTEYFRALSITPIWVVSNGRDVDGELTYRQRDTIRLIKHELCMRTATNTPD